MTSKLIQKKYAILLFLLSVLVYNINQREISSYDTLPSRYLPISIINEFNLDLDEFPHLYSESKKNGYRKDPRYDTPYYIRKINGHYYSNYPILIPLLAVPVYFIPLSLGLPVNDRTVDMLSKFAATIFAGLSVLFFYLVLRRITDERTALLVSFIYAFATSTWSISSQGLWKHGPMVLFLILTIYFLLKGIEKEKYVIYSAIPLGLAVLCRQSSIIIAGMVLVYVLLNHRKCFPGFLAIFTLFMVLLVGYNLHFFGHILGGNYFLQQDHHIPYYKMGEKGIWSAPLFIGLYGLLASPSRGLFVYSPVLIFAFAGMFYAWQDKKHPIFKLLIVSVIVYILFLSKFSAWWGGHCFGPRYFTDIMPFLCIFLVFIVKKVFRHRILAIAFMILLVYSLFVQVVGAFFYPSGWNFTLEDGNRIQHERLWNWKDSQLVWCVGKAFKNKNSILEKSVIRERKTEEYYQFPGQKIDFRTPDSRRYVEYGWNMPESWGTWASGPESLLLLNFNGIRHRKFTMKAISFKKHGKNQAVKIYLNDKLVKEYVFNHFATEWEIIDVEIPGRYFNGGLEELKFVYNHLKRASLRDLRSIAMGLEYIQFSL